MLWQGRRESSNVEDRRGIGGGHIAVGGGILGVIALLVNFLLGGDNSQMPLPNQNQPISAEEQAVQDSESKFVKVVLAETEDVWRELMTKAGHSYTEPKLVLLMVLPNLPADMPAPQRALFIAPVTGTFILTFLFMMI